MEGVWWGGGECLVLLADVVAIVDQLAHHRELAVLHRLAQQGVGALAIEKLDEGVQLQLK
jgi:hypothetical protein